MIRPHTNGYNRLITRRSINTNGKTLLAHSLHCIDIGTALRTQALWSSKQWWQHRSNKRIQSFLPISRWQELSDTSMLE